MTIQKNKYIFEEGIEPTDDSIYALIRSAERTEPEEIYISVEDREKITVLKQFNFCGYSVVGERFLDRMYFVKINLPEKQTMPLYLSTANADHLNEHVVLFRSSYFGVRAHKGETYICLEDERRKRYIALSELNN